MPARIESISHFSNKRNYKIIVMSKLDPNLSKELSNCIRILSADAIEKAKSGHPGLPLGMADVMTVLAFDFLRYNPEDPKWDDRDRLVLSAGHGSMLLYSFYYLSGYKDFTLDDIKNFRQMNSKSPGHPEYGAYPAIETSTGPLGQGLANAVGMAIAAKKLGKNYKIYAIVGDGCLMEGIAYEALSLAGHLRLDNLIVLFDDNKITIDGATSLTISEDHHEKLNSMGWNCFENNGQDHDSIYNSIQTAIFSGKPSFISCKTTIGYGSPNKSGTCDVHGAPLGQDEISNLRMTLGWDVYEEFEIPEDLLKSWRSAFRNNFSPTTSNEPTEYKVELDPKNIYEMYPIMNAEATRVSSGKVIANLMNLSNKAIFGSADLAGSNNISNLNSRPISEGNYFGNFIYYGIREHAMGAIMNGLALSGMKAVGGTFLVFSDYMRPAIRLAAMMKLPVVYVFTHDSIGLGEDGPTHQPVEHLAALRSIPNLYVIRPADFVETVEAWQIAWDRYSGPTALILSRQKTNPIRSTDDVNQTLLGAYTLSEDLDHKVTIFASGSEVNLAQHTAEILRQNEITVRIVSIPCIELFEQQEESYKEELLESSKINVVIETGCRMGWDKFIGKNGIFFGVEDYGHSAPYKDIYRHFGLEPELMAAKIIEKL